MKRTPFIRSPLSGWVGGKFQLAKQIVSMIPEHQCYIEPFAGAAWVYFRKENSEVEVLNDINLEIVTLYRVIQYHLEEFIRYFKWVLVSRDEFERMQRVDASTLTDIQRAARFFYLQKSAFAGRIDHPSFGYATTRPPRLNLLRIELVPFSTTAALKLMTKRFHCLFFTHQVNIARFKQSTNPQRKSQ